MIKNKIVKYYARKDSNIALKVIPGHFVTNHSHLNYYLDMTTMKTRQNEAERIAIAMKDYYNVMDKPIDTIVFQTVAKLSVLFLQVSLADQEFYQLMHIRLFTSSLLNLIPTDK